MLQPKVKAKEFTKYGYDVTIHETPVCWLADFRKHIKRQLEEQ